MKTKSDFYYSICKKYLTINRTLWLSFFSIIIYSLMSFWLFPAIEQNSNGLKAFDMALSGYSITYASNFLQSLSPSSRNLYLFIQKPLDMIFPIFYGLSFIGIIIHLTSKKSGKIAYLFPLLIVFFDYIENIFIIFMLSTNLVPNEALLQIASFATIGKTIAITIITGFILFLLLKKCWVKIFKQQ